MNLTMPQSGLTRLRNHFRVEGLRYSSVVLDSLLEQRSVDEEITPLTLAVLIYRQMAPVLLGLGAHVKDSRQRKTVTPLVAACLIGESDMVSTSKSCCFMLHDRIIPVVSIF